MRWQPGIRIERDPNSDKDWRLDLSLWLVDGDTISQAQVVEQGNLTVTATPDGTDVVMWVSGGSVDTFETVTLRVTTAGGRVDDFSTVFVQRAR